METKKCSKCKQKLTIDEFGKHKGTKDKLQPECKECKKIRDKEYRDKKRIEKGIIIIIPGKGMKICSRCKIELSVGSFGKNKGSKSGLNSYCKKCNIEHTKIYYKENTEKVTQYSRTYRKENSEQIAKGLKIYYKNNTNKLAEYQKKYNKNNQEKVSNYHKNYRITNLEISLENGRKYYEEHSEKRKAYARKYKTENPEKCSILGQKRRAKKLLLLSTFTNEQWEKAKSYFENKCCYCGRELPLTQEHWIPVSKGGNYDALNIIPACKHCNSSKGNRDFFKFYPKYKFYSKKREKLILKFLNYNKQNEQQLSIL